MISSFRCKETEKIWHGLRSKKFPSDFQDRALCKLRQLDAAINADDLRLLPGNNLEMLKGDRAGQMSIRINQKWRICFIFKNCNAYEVGIIDYH